jgi:hypothetical protein
LGIKTHQAGSVLLQDESGMTGIHFQP